MTFKQRGKKLELLKFIAKYQNKIISSKIRFIDKVSFTFITVLTEIAKYHCCIKNSSFDIDNGKIGRKCLFSERS